MAAGMALTMSPLTALIMSSVPPGSAGVGSAMNDTTRELGGALGVAVLGSLVTSRFAASLGSATDLLPEGSRDLARAGLAEALAAAGQVGGSAGDAVAAAARQAFVDGLGLATLVAAVIVLVAAATARLLLPRAPQAHLPQVVDPEAERAASDLAPEPA
jgi:hypothetical protein